MTCVEHYFENLIFEGEDCRGRNWNKNELSTEAQQVVEECVQHLLYSIFCGREDFLLMYEKYEKGDE